MRGLCLASLCLLLEACTALPPAQQSLAEFDSGQRAGARQHEAQGRPAQALASWRSLLPVSDDPEVLEAVARLETEIAGRAARAVQNGSADYRRGNIRDGDTWMLRALALDPGNPAALAALQRSSSRQAVAQQASKSASENQALLARREAAPGGLLYELRNLYGQRDYRGMIALGEAQAQAPEGEAAQLLRSAHLALAEESLASEDKAAALDQLQRAMSAQAVEDDPLPGQVARLRIELSQQWYRRGVGLMQSDLSGAIAALEEAVRYNPYNDPAQLKLKQARTLQKNLEKIRGG